MAFVIRIVDVAGKVTRSNTPKMVGHYVEYYDPEAHKGRGDVKGTLDISRAKQFATGQEAMEFYRQTSRKHPRRLDGMPNRPLTAFTVEILPVPKE
jgi:hypothetical protein